MIEPKAKYDYILGRHQKHKYLMSVGVNYMSIDYCRKYSLYEDGLEDGSVLKDDEICAGLPDTKNTKGSLIKSEK